MNTSPLLRHTFTRLIMLTVTLLTLWLPFALPNHVARAEFQSSAPAAVSQVTLGESSAAAPALMVFNNQLYLAWTGIETATRLNLMFLNGQTFSNKVTLPESSSTGPALDSFNNQLYITWTGTDVYKQLSGSVFVDPSSHPIVDQTRAALASTLE